MRWIGTDSADILLVREDSLTRDSSSLIEDLRWRESVHHQRRHPVLLVVDESRTEKRLAVDGILSTSWNADLIASELRYWLAHSTSIR